MTVASAYQLDTMPPQGCETEVLPVRELSHFGYKMRLQFLPLPELKFVGSKGQTTVDIQGLY